GEGCGGARSCAASLSASLGKGAANDPIDSGRQTRQIQNHPTGPLALLTFGGRIHSVTRRPIRLRLGGVMARPTRWFGRGRVPASAVTGRSSRRWPPTATAATP